MGPAALCTINRRRIPVYFDVFGIKGSKQKQKNTMSDLNKHYYREGVGANEKLFCKGMSGQPAIHTSKERLT